MSDIAIIDLTERATLATRATCALSELGDTIGRGLVAVFDHMEAVGITPDGPPYVRYLSFAPEHIDMEIGFPAPAGSETSGEVERASLPAGEAVRMVHVGPYEDLPSAHEQIQSFIAARDLRMSSGSWEVYLNDPGTTPREELRTEVVYPIAR